MPSLLEDRDKKDLLARFSRLTPDSQRRWGTLTAHRMICHLGDQMRAAVGDVETRRLGNFLTRTLIKRLVLSLPLPTPRGKIQTVREMLSTEPTTWEADTEAFKVLVERLVTAREVAPHPIFGRLSHREWCVLAAKHIDHHLRQFGV